MELAEVSRPHGVRGEVRVKLYNSDSDLIALQREVLMRRQDGSEGMLELESVRGADAGYLLAKIRGVDDRNAADALRGARLSVRRDAFPPPEEGEFYACDVMGARVIGPDGDLGTVEDLATYPSADALVVRLEGGDRGEVPLIEEFVELIDPAAGQVRLHRAGMDFLSGHAVEKPDAD